MTSHMRLSTTSATILVVADDPRARRTLWTTLSSEGCLVVEAKSGGEALVRLANDRPDLILVDLMAEPPDLMCREIRGLTDVPMIVFLLPRSEQNKAGNLGCRGGRLCGISVFGKRAPGTCPSSLTSCGANGKSRDL